MGPIGAPRRPRASNMLRATLPSTSPKRESSRATTHAIRSDTTDGAGSAAAAVLAVAVGVTGVARPAPSDGAKDDGGATVGAAVTAPTQWAAPSAQMLTAVAPVARTQWAAQAVPKRTGLDSTEAQPAARTRRQTILAKAPPATERQT